MADYETLLYEDDEGQVSPTVVTLNRPRGAQCVPRPGRTRQMRDVWTALQAPTTRSGPSCSPAHGEKAFCTGIDRMRSHQHGYLEQQTSAGPKSGRVSTPFMYNGPRDQHQSEGRTTWWKPVSRSGERHGPLAVQGALHAGRGGHHRGGRSRHVLRSPRHLRDGGRLRVDAPAPEAPARRDLAGGPARCARADVGGAPSETRPGFRKLLRGVEAHGQGPCGSPKDLGAAAPVLAVQGTLQAVWMAHEVSTSRAAPLAAGVEASCQHQGQSTRTSKGLSLILRFGN